MLPSHFRENFSALRMEVGRLAGARAEQRLRERENLCAIRRKRNSRSGRSCWNETEREREKGVRWQWREEGIHRTDTSLWLCCMPPGYPASHRLHPSPFLPYLYPSLSLPLSLIDATQLVSPRLCLFLAFSLSLSSSLARHAALVRSHSRSPLRCLWSPGSSLLALVRSILHERER